MQKYLLWQNFPLCVERNRSTLGYLKKKLELAYSQRYLINLKGYTSFSLIKVFAKIFNENEYSASSQLIGGFPFFCLGVREHKKGWEPLYWIHKSKTSGQELAQNVHIQVRMAKDDDDDADKDFEAVRRKKRD